jgi:8-oxo-dGTP pyrophosphatase MutT (NUDIX family)
MLYYTFCYNDCMPEVSVGILIYRWRKKVLEVFLIHPGGPFWKNKDAGAWSIPKGILDPGEDPLEGAQREFYEETGFDVPGDLIPLAAAKAHGSGSRKPMRKCTGGRFPFSMNSWGSFRGTEDGSRMPL